MGKFLLDETDYRALEDFVNTGLSLPATLAVFEAMYPVPNLVNVSPDLARPQQLHGEIGNLFVDLHKHAQEYVKGFSGLSELGMLVLERPQCFVMSRGLIWAYLCYSPGNYPLTIA